MSDIIVSAHGGRWSNQNRNYHVPVGSEVVYYVQDGGILPNREGYEILGALEQGHEPQTPSVQTVGGGGYTYNYSCWYAYEFGQHCGIFEVGTGRQLMSLNQYTENQPLLLSDIITMFPDRKVYWDCCREVAQP